ncbi:apontic [Holotrichia oblita]|uniref:Apontic n=1 Tax=Holotrichia oblita TaxID=644536 RepID=A0ACB9THK5_HOLOL|nr:apontic [Holotrichia oblita]
MNDKRARAANFSSEEKIQCLSLIKKYKNIIESKQTGSISWKKKEEVWQAIEKEFNSHSLVFRSADVLKRFYNNNKKEMRKLAANTKANMQATGGGPSSSSQSSNPVYDLTLDIINKKTVFGLINKYDDDAEVILQENLLYTIYILNIFQKDSNRIYEDTQEGFIQNFEITNEEETNNVETIIIEMDSETNSHKADKDTNEYTAQNDWGACTSQMLKTPVNPKLKEKKDKKKRGYAEGDHKFQRQKMLQKNMKR